MIYFLVCNEYLEHLFSLSFDLEKISPHKLIKLKKAFIFALGPLPLYFLLILLSVFLYSLVFFLSFFSIQPLLDLEKGVYRVLKGFESISNVLILRGVLWILNTESLRGLCVWTHKNPILFLHDSCTVKVD